MAPGDELLSAEPFVVPDNRLPSLVSGRPVNYPPGTLLGKRRMAFWLMKTEPEDYSWDQLVADGETEWTGVRNYQAAANMRAMKEGERVFFYRSVVEPGIVGVMSVSQAAYPASNEPGEKFVCVKVKPLRPVRHEVALATIKADPRFADFKLVRQGRLSVVPVSDDHWTLLCQMAGIPV